MWKFPTKNHVSMDWFKGKSTGTIDFPIKYGFSCKCSLNQSIDGFVEWGVFHMNGGWDFGEILFRCPVNWMPPVSGLLCLVCVASWCKRFFKLYISIICIIWWFPKIRGAPKSSIFIGFSTINHPFGESPFWESSISIYRKMLAKIAETSDF